MFCELNEYGLFDIDGITPVSTDLTSNSLLRPATILARTIHELTGAFTKSDLVEINQANNSLIADLPPGSFATHIDAIWKASEQLRIHACLIDNRSKNRIQIDADPESRPDTEHPFPFCPIITLSDRSAIDDLLSFPETIIIEQTEDEYPLIVDDPRNNPIDLNNLTASAPWEWICLTWSDIPGFLEMPASSISIITRRNAWQRWLQGDLRRPASITNDDEIEIPF